MDPRKGVSSADFCVVAQMLLVVRLSYVEWLNMLLFTGARALSVKKTKKQTSKQTKTNKQTKTALRCKILSLLLQRC